MKLETKTVVGLGLLTAIVVVLQALCATFPVFPFTITLALVPILVGAALYGPLAGAWLGFVFGVVVLLTNAGAFLAISIPGTIITCLAKGMVAGLAAGLIYKVFELKNRTLGVILAAIAEPIVNTGLFLVGCLIFFYSTICEWAAASGFSNAGAFLIFGMVGVNFLIEMVINIVLSTAIVRIINLGRGALKAE